MLCTAIYYSTSTFKCAVFQNTGCQELAALAGAESLQGLEKSEYELFRNIDGIF